MGAEPAELRDGRLGRHGRGEQGQGSIGDKSEVLTLTPEAKVEMFSIDALELADIPRNYFHWEGTVVKIFNFSPAI